MFRLPLPLGSFCVLLLALNISGCPNMPPTGETSTIALFDVRYWAYQLQGLDEPGAIDALVNSSYDLLVLEPTNTDAGSADFDAKNMVSRLHASASSVSGKTKLVIAYIDIGEAEDWRTYWDEDWIAPTEQSAGTPDFMIRPDPDGWAGDYPVAFWDARWKNLIIYDDDSMLQRALDDGFDGIYMDWVEAYADEGVIQAAEDAGVDPVEEMVEFIREIRAVARQQNPDFIVIPQNASELATESDEYLDLIDAIGQEAVYFDGDDNQEGDIPMPATGEGFSTAYFEEMLALYLQAGKVVLTVDYAQDPANVADAYERAAENGFVPYVSLRELDRLTSNPPPALKE